MDKLIFKKIMWMAIWFGLVTGLVEGIALWIFQQQGWLTGKIVFLGSGPEIFWISPLYDLILFTLLGLLVYFVYFLFRRLPILKISSFLFSFVLVFNWLFIPLHGRISPLAVFVLAAGVAIQITYWLGKRIDKSLIFFRRSLPWLLTLALLTFVGIQGGNWLRERIAIARLSKNSSNTPNILVIVVDTLRADHLSSYGYSRQTSPNIDQLADEGVLFEQAYATSSWTPPSHASILTGRWTFEHGADITPLDNRYPTIGEQLYENGYRTAAFSANFETFKKVYGFGRGFIRFEDYYRSIENIAVSTLYGRAFEYYIIHKLLNYAYKPDRKLGPDINHSVLSWVDQDLDVPFFIFINYYDVHPPYIPPEPYRNRFSSVKNPGGLINTDWGMDQIYIPMTSEQLQGEIDAYDGAIAYTDDNISNLLKELEKRGLLDNMIVVITSDHGESFGEHDLLEHHNSLYREVIHVPLIIWWPGKLPEGIRISRTVSNAALPATLLQLIGAEAKSPFPGPSLSLLWEQPNNYPYWPDLIAEVEQAHWLPVQHLPYHGSMRSIFNSDWQYIIHEKFGEELYKWASDPQEIQNLAMDSESQPVIDQFRAQLSELTTNTSTLEK